MRISDRYIAGQVLTGTLYAVIVLGIVLVLGNLFKQVQPLLVDQKAPFGLVLRFVIGVLPLSLMYTIPWGFLTAVLMVFGRMSANHEITSFRVAGLSLARLSAPVFLIGALLSLLSLWLNVNVVPNAKSSTRELVYEQAARNPASLLKPGVVQGDFKGNGQEVQKLLIEGKSGEWVEGFHFHVLPKDKADGSDTTYVHAARAALSVDHEKSQLRLKLVDAYFETRDAKGKVEMVFAGEAEPLVIDLKSTRDRKMRPSLMSNELIRREIAGDPAMTVKTRLKLESEIMTRYSFSMACLAFAFVGVPLGLQSHRKDTTRGLMISVLIGTGYFLITMAADQVESGPVATAVLWTPNVLCVLCGLLLFRKVRFS
jgi:lipopolysaccharide export system permease protein